MGISALKIGNAGSSLDRLTEPDSTKDKERDDSQSVTY